MRRNFVTALPTQMSMRLRGRTRSKSVQRSRRSLNGLSAWVGPPMNLPERPKRHLKRRQRPFVESITDVSPSWQILIEQHSELLAVVWHNKVRDLVQRNVV